MPTVKIINDTQVPLHICLKQISPLHYANSVAPGGGSATFKVGRVWFTIQARIDRGDNTYDKFQTFAPIAAVTIGALSLGAGAVYIAGAAGGAAAALTARVSATVAAHTPTAKRLLKLASKGQTVAKVGQVVGLGGATLAKARKSPKEHATTAAKVALKKLLQGSVVSSPGWYMDRDRTLRITGGPRASQVDGLLVIETDTAKPFEIRDETGKTVAMGNQDGGEEVPGAEEDKVEKTEQAAKLEPEPQPQLADAAPPPPKKKDGFWMRTIKGENSFFS